MKLDYIYIIGYIGNKNICEFKVELKLKLLEYTLD